MFSKKKLLSKPVLAGVVVIVIAGSIFGWRASQAGKDEPKKADPSKVVMEFTQSDVATVRDSNAATRSGSRPRPAPTCAVSNRSLAIRCE